MRRDLRYSSAALADLRSIAAYTRREHGREQASRYLGRIADKIERIAGNPMLGQDAELPRAGLRKIRAGSHVVFFVASADVVEVVRILHESQDFERRLG